MANVPTTSHSPITLQWQGQLHTVSHKQGFELVTDRGNIDIDTLRTWELNWGAICNDPPRLFQLLGWQWSEQAERNRQKEQERAARVALRTMTQLHTNGTISTRRLLEQLGIDLQELVVSAGLPAAPTGPTGVSGPVGPMGPPGIQAGQPVAVTPSGQVQPLQPGQQLAGLVVQAMETSINTQTGQMTQNITFATPPDTSKMTVHLVIPEPDPVDVLTAPKPRRKLDRQKPASKSS